MSFPVGHESYLRGIQWFSFDFSGHHPCVKLRFLIYLKCFFNTISAVKFTMSKHEM